jgi:hypothetical protein
MGAAVSRATLTGLRRASGVTIGPSRIRSVAVAIAASVIHGSATSTTGSRFSDSRARRLLDNYHTTLVGLMAAAMSISTTSSSAGDRPREPSTAAPRRIAEHPTTDLGSCSAV